MTSVSENEDDRPPMFEKHLVALIPKLNRHALALTGSKPAAEDLVQNTCVRALDRWHQWRAEGSLVGWVITIMESIWLNDRRRIAQRGEQPLRDVDEVLDRGFEGQVQARFMLAMLRSSGAVSDEDFSLVAKIHLHNYTYRDLAEQLGMPIGTVLARVSRARVALRKAADELDREGGK